MTFILVGGFAVSVINVHVLSWTKPASTFRPREIRLLFGFALNGYVGSRH